MNINNCRCGNTVSGYWIEDEKPLYIISCNTCQCTTMFYEEEQTIHDWNSWMVNP